MNELPLHGITVLDLTRLLPGAFATQMLADEGAEVIKVEQPGAGDYARTLSPAVFVSTNAGKKSIAVDLKNPAGREVLLTLAANADVLIEGFRPGVMARLGLDYDAVHAIHPHLIYVSLTGYGQTGPYAGLAGHDVNYIAMGGLLGLNLPVIPGVQIGDLVGGSMEVVIRILLALHGRHTTGRGGYVDVSMTEGVKRLLAVPLAGEAGHEMLTGRYACYNLYQAQDGRWIAVGALEAKFWVELCDALGCQEFVPAQFDGDRQDEIKAWLRKMFATRNAGDWFALLSQRDCCVTPVLTLSELRANPPASRPPGIGEHTDEILRNCAYSEEQLQTLRRAGAVA
jgi:alpha-methylacyl-CoA racemase